MGVLLHSLFWYLNSFQFCLGPSDWRCNLRGLAQCCAAGDWRGPVLLWKAASDLLLPSLASSWEAAEGTGERGRGRGERLGRDFLQQEGWPVLLVGCGPGLSRGGGCAVECLVLPGNVFVFAVWCGLVEVWVFLLFWVFFFLLPLNACFDLCLLWYFQWRKVWAVSMD